MSTPVDLLPRGTLAYDFARTGVAVRLLKRTLYEALPGYLRRAIDRHVAPKRRHDYQRAGYGGAGWTVYECACGAKEIDA